MANVMLFYKDITPINKVSHKNLKFAPPSDMSFAKDTHWVPLASSEYFQAALHYPILFMCAEDEQKKKHYTSAALVGLSNDENDYITSDKSWEKILMFQLLFVAILLFLHNLKMKKSFLFALISNQACLMKLQAQNF